MKKIFGLIALSSAIFAIEQEHPHSYSLKPILLNTRESEADNSVFKIATTGGTAEYSYLKLNDFYVDGSFTFLLSDKKPRGAFDIYNTRRLFTQFSLGYSWGTPTSSITPFLGFGLQSQTTTQKWFTKRVVAIPENKQKMDDKTGKMITEKTVIDWHKIENTERSLFNEIGMRAQFNFAEIFFVGMKGSAFVFPGTLRNSRTWGYQATLPVGFTNEYFDFAISPLVRMEFAKPSGAKLLSTLQDVGASFDLSVNF